MNKAQLIDRLAAKQGITKVQAAANIEALLAEVHGALARGERVQFVGFGSFEVRPTGARKGRNPRTNEVIKIEAGRKVRFHSSAALKKSVNTKSRKKPAKG